MSGETTGLVPKLRFPEFRDSNEWEQATLGEMSSILKGKGISKADLDPSGPRACIRYGELYTRYGETIREAVSRTKVPDSELFLSKLDDVIVPSSGETKSDIAKASCVLADGIALGGDLNVIRSKLKGTFLSYYLNGPKRQDIAKVAQGDTVVHLYPHQLAALKLAVPTPDEQQKIADCLGSLDELIAAEGRKVEALKAHKKGLMQQLFPREGITQPSLRFPEFQSAGKWMQKSLGGLCRIRTGKKDANEGAPDGAYPFFTCAEKHIFSHNYSFDAEAILIAGNANVGQTSYYNGKFEAYQRTYVLTDFNDIFVPYLYSVLNANLRPDLLAQVQTSAMSYIRLPMLEEYQINAPSSQAEQQRIADCLRSLDTQITAATQTLDTLKTHKQGLMQQLFPSPEAVVA